MGTHPIFESDFDCLTDGMNRLWRLAISIVTIGLSIGYILWGKKKKPIDNVARFKELTVIKLYSKIDECRSKFNRMLVLAPSSGGQNQHDSGDELSSPGDDVLVTDWDRSRESLNGISEDIHPDCFKPVPGQNKISKMSENKKILKKLFDRIKMEKMNFINAKK